MSIPIRSIGSVFVVLLVTLPGWAYQAPPPGAVLPDIESRPAGSVQASPAALRATSSIETAAGRPLSVRWDPSAGRVRWLHAFGEPLAPVAASDPEAAARAFLSAHPSLFAFAAADTLALEKAYIHETAGGISIVGLRQTIRGIPVYRGEVRVAVDHHFLPISADLMDTRPGFTGDPTPRISPWEGAAAALRSIGLKDPILRGPDNLAEETLRFEALGLASPMRTRLEWFPLGAGARLAWHSYVETRRYPALYDILIDASTGELLSRHNIMRYADTRAHVFTEHPMAGPRRLETVFDGDVNVLPFDPAGWIASDTTSGNNAYAQDDRASDNEMTPGVMPVATPGAPQVFDPPFTGDGLADVDLGVVNLFWALNFAHDYFYALGFTESAGNFQQENFGLGGLGNDPVFGDAEDGADTLVDADPGNDIANNANFGAIGDGTPGRMQMYLWNSPLPMRDGDLDIDVVIHEYVHGVSGRLVGGPLNPACLNSQQGGSMGEGWSDYFPGSVFNDPLMGEYATQDFAVGIRTARMDADNYTYGDFCHIIGGCEVHADGEIWAQALWEMRASVLPHYGYKEGRDVADSLVIDGMKLAPCNPSFLAMRDAILLADEVRYSGVHRCLLWQVFAQNGMGTGAQDNTGGDETIVVEDFSVPAECDPAQGLGAVAFSASGYSCDDKASARVVDADLALPATIEIQSQSGDSLTLNLQEGPAGAPVFVTAEFPVVRVATPPEINTADAVLQWMDGDTLTVTYIDATNGGNVSDTASAACLADVVVAGYRIVGESCDNDNLQAYPLLPAFLDAGESAVLEVDLANRGPSALVNVTATLTASHALVIVEPAAGLTVPRMEAAAGANPGITTLRFLIAARPGVTTGETNDFTLTLTARGYTSTILPITWTVELNRDYVTATQSLKENFDPGSPTAPLWTHGPTKAAPSGDEWTTVTCESVSAPASIKNGGGDPGCDDYTDDQGDPYFASPPQVLQSPGVLAARPSRLRFSHHVQLAIPSDPFGGVCDAEAVIIFVVNDPAAIDTSDPLRLFPSALGVYTVVPAYALDDNNTGFEPQDLDLSAVDFSGVDLTQNAYLTWIMLMDFTNPLVGPFCSSFDAQGEGYYFDDVDFEWELTTKGDQQTVCTAGCQIEPKVAPEGVVLFCPGDAVDLTAAPTFDIRCPGGLQYKWSGGELGAGAFGPDPAVTVHPTDTSTYTVEIECMSSACNVTRDVVVASRSHQPVGGPIGNVLMVWKNAGSTLRFDWSLAPLDPRAYTLFQADGKLLIDDVSIVAQTAAARADGAETADIADPAGNTLFFEVYGSDPCTGQGYSP